MVFVQEHTVYEIEDKGFHIKQGMAKSFYDQSIVTASYSAEEYGSMYTMPEFLRLLCLVPFDDPLWKLPFTVKTEEIIGKTRAGKRVAVTVHGAGLLTPERIKLGKLTKTANGRGEGALHLYPQEVYALLEGKPASGDIDVYSYSDFKKGISNLPRRRAIVRDFHSRTELPEGTRYLRFLLGTPRIISLADNIETLSLYFDLVQLRYNTQEAVYHHPLHHLDMDQPQGRLLEVRGPHQLFYSEMEMDGTARFLSVKREDLEERISGILNIDYE